MIYFVQGKAQAQEEPLPSYLRLETNAPLKSVFFVPDDDANQFEATLIYPVGEADMQGPEGIAHYIEHLVVWSALPEERRDLARDFNAYTSKTNTTYFMTSDDLGEILDYLSDTAAPIEIDERFMVEELDIVSLEFQRNFAENPILKLSDRREETIFGPTGLARSVIGDPSTIKEISPADAIELHSEFYNLGNASLVITGKIEEAELVAHIETAFAGYTGSAKPRSLEAEKLKTTGETQEIFPAEKLASDIYQTSWVTPLPDWDDATLLSLEILTAAILSSRKEGMLTRQLIFEDELFDNFSFYTEKFPGNMGMSFNLFADSNETLQPYISESYQTWLNNFETNLEVINDVIDATRENMLDTLIYLEPKQIYSEIIAQIENNYAAPLTAEAFALALKNINASDVQAYMRYPLEHGRETSTIWEGKIQ